MSQEADVQGLLSELLELGHTPKPPPTLGTQQAFDWVADCTAWLCQRAAPDLAVPRDYSSEAKRVAFLSALGSQLYSRTRIRLHLRRLYRAGGGAVRELRRLAASLAQAAAELAPPAATPANLPPLPELDRPQLNELSQRIGASAAQLVAALAAAPAAAAGARAALAATTDVDGMEAELRAALAAARQQKAQLEPAVAALGQEVALLEARVEKRHVELDRLERRLDSLQAVKPAFSAEAEALEAELAGLYQQYLHRFRNLEWLEGSLDAYAAERQAEAEEADKQLRRIQRQVAAEELRLLQGDQNGSPNTPGAEPADGLDSDDSEAAVPGGWGLKALPCLGGGNGGAGAGGGVRAAGGSPGRSAAALDLQLLSDEESGGGGGGAAGSRGGTAASKGGASRLSLASGGSSDVAGAAGGDTSPGRPQEGSKVTFGGASLITAPRGGPSSGGSQRPGSARRATGSANAMLRGRAGGGEGGGADVLSLDSPLASPARRSNMQGDNDF